MLFTYKLATYMYLSIRDVALLQNALFRGSYGVSSGSCRVRVSFWPCVAMATVTVCV